jgi:Ca2+/Na+ antiporter
MTFDVAASQFWSVSPGTALLAVAALTLYVASRAAADALAGGDPDRPGLRALGHCVPVAVTALICLHPSMGRPGVDDPVSGRPEIAVGVVFANCVACLTLVLGILAYVVPAAPTLPHRKAWPFVLPAALLTLIAGFGGRLTWVHALALLILGTAVMNLWLGGAEGNETPGGDISADAHPIRAGGLRWTRWLQLVLALALAAVGGWAAARGASLAEQSSRLLTGVVLASTVLGPLLTLPVLGGTTQVAERGHAGSAMSTLAAIVLINLCAVLPLVILAHYALTASSPAVAAAATQPADVQAVDLRAVPFPLISWRVDSVILVVLGFMLIPVSLGRWVISRIEAGVLIFAYAFYLAMVAILSTRRH